MLRKKTNQQVKRVFLLLDEQIYRDVQVKAAMDGRKYTDMIRDFIIAGLNPPVVIASKTELPSS